MISYHRNTVGIEYYGNIMEDIEPTIWSYSNHPKDAEKYFQHNMSFQGVFSDMFQVQEFSINIHDFVWGPGISVAPMTDGSGPTTWSPSTPQGIHLFVRTLLAAWSSMAIFCARGLSGVLSLNSPKAVQSGATPCFFFRWSWYRQWWVVDLDHITT